MVGGQTQHVHVNKAPPKAIPQRKIKGVKGQRNEASGQTKAESSAKNHETAENSR